MFPRVRFLLNKKLDERVIADFLGHQQGGANFPHSIVRTHPKLGTAQRAISERTRRNLVHQYVVTFYRYHAPLLRKRTAEFRDRWRTIETRFLTEARTIFGGQPFPPGRYIGYLSIVNCNPRFLKDKTFQVFYLHPLGVRYVVSHELMHFLFYDFVQKHCPRLRHLDTETGLLWDVAEVVNAIILHSPPFPHMHGVNKCISYSRHQKYLPRLFKIWRNKRDIHYLINKAQKLLHKEEGG